MATISYPVGTRVMLDDDGTPRIGTIIHVMPPAKRGDEAIITIVTPGGSRRRSPMGAVTATF